MYSHNTVLGSHENKWIRIIYFSVNKSQKHIKSKQKPRSPEAMEEYTHYDSVCIKFKKRKISFLYVCMCVCVCVQVLESIKKRKVLINTKFKVAFSCGRFVKWMFSVTESGLTLCNRMDCSPPGSSVQVSSLS